MQGWIPHLSPFLTILQWPNLRLYDARYCEARWTFLTVIWLHTPMKVQTACWHVHSEAWHLKHFCTCCFFTNPSLSHHDCSLKSLKETRCETNVFWRPSPVLSNIVVHFALLKSPCESLPQPQVTWEPSLVSILARSPCLEHTLLLEIICKNSEIFKQGNVW